MSHSHLSVEDREIIALMSDHYTQAEIAGQINKHQSTISRELRRNRSEDGWYRPVAADGRAGKRRREANESRGRKMDHPELSRHVLKGLSWRWSPEQISGRIRLEYDDKPALWISHERIYTWIWQDKGQGGSLHVKLRQGHKKNKRRARGKADGRKTIPNRIWIDDRPEEVNERSRAGDWEGDTLLGRGKKHAVVSLTERKSQYLVLGKMNQRNWRTLNAAAQRSFARHDRAGHLPRTTITVDNGREFWGHEDLAGKLNVDVYFARPYHPWQRGLNEQVNGLIRQFIPKSKDLRTITVKELKRIEEKLNNRPRKKLGYLTPLEVIRGQCHYAFRV
jgi:IS30 family transposase